MSLWILFSLLEQQLALAKGFGVPLLKSLLRVASLRVAIAPFYFYCSHTSLFVTNVVFLRKAIANSIS
ncbi:hypothetical protein H6G93_21870 [Nostoc sp. FACHB-973]|nr:hypothetical protein [Nostoc sp. FACHB-973]